jgi:ketosteroid isomerase-like protein
MSVTADYVRDLFGNLETGKLERFFSRVADDVDWTVMAPTLLRDITLRRAS